MQPTRVGDEEDLYRAILANSDQYAFRDGRLVFGSTAFNDRNRKPSVDRSSLRSIPAGTRFRSSDGVTRIRTADVRRIRSIQVYPTDRTSYVSYDIDAIHRPRLASEAFTENLAHCQIECAPELMSDTHFKKLKEALARLASMNGFIVEPSSE